MKKLAIAALLVAGFASVVDAAQAQVAGSTTVGVSVTELSQVALGWSVKKSILGKALYNDAGESIGHVDDLIISPDRKLSYLIVGAGGFLGIGRHDVAIPANQVQDHAGKLVLPGATKDIVKSMPRFEYANEPTQRDAFVAAAEQDLGKAKAKVADLEKQTTTAASEVKTKLDSQIAAMRKDLKAAEDKLRELKRANALYWKKLEDEVDVAMARLRKAV